MQIKTTFVGRNPFMPKKQPVFTDPETLKITSDPLPKARVQVNKYHSIFQKMKPGQCIRCATDDVGKIGNALRSYIEKKAIKGSVKSVLRYPNDDGFGRVWLMGKS